jgi:hypothetical protein
MAKQPGSKEGGKMARRAVARRSTKPRTSHPTDQADYRKRNKTKGIIQVALLLPENLRDKFLKLARRLRKGRSLDQALAKTFPAQIGKLLKETERRRPA